MLHSLGRPLAALLAILTLAACEAPQPVVTRPTPVVAIAAPAPPRLTAREAASNFIAVAEAMEPRIEAECRARTRGSRDCDYRIMVDDRRDRSPNAFQTVDKAGHPVVAFNLALIAEARNAHHILGHLQSKSEDAAAGAMILGVLAAASGADATQISHAQDIGATVGSRAYSKDYELQADRLGTIITWDAGYDPLQGAQFFTRIPDPGDVFLGSHPANALRVDVVRETVAELRRGRI